MRRAALALLAALGLLAGCTQNFDAFTIGHGGAGGDASVSDGMAGSAGQDASIGGSEGGVDASRDSGSDAPPDAPSDAPPDAPVCGTGSKLCNASCVLDDNPDFGCAGPSCTPCSTANAAAACDSTGHCAIGACSQGYADCNHDPSDGCEKNLQTDPGNCGSCGTPCVEAHATASCSAGKCAISSCDAGYQDCNANPGDGCEINTDSDPSNCGACGNDCTTNGGNWVCSSGNCEPSNCPSGTGNCNGDTTCSTDLTTTQNCGFCGHDCTTSVLHASGVSCGTGGKCTYTGSCDAGWADCDGNKANGCEVNVASSAANCGACGRSCSTSHTSSPPSCKGGICTPTCSSGFADCTHPAAPALDDGCETAVSSDPNNCGACGRKCSTAHVASASCSGGRCDSSCSSGWDNCTQPLAPTADDGCETNTANDPNNCGSCGRYCSSNHVQAGGLGCSGGTCAPTCDPGYKNCTSPTVDDGCETDISNDVDNCGACGRKCSTSHVSSRSCSNGLCNSFCLSGYDNCSQPAAPAADDGCEANIGTDVNNCGGCGRVCSSTNVATRSCSGGRCDSSCNSGWGNCTQPTAPSSDDGCETDITTDPNHCGSCSRACSTTNTTKLSCAKGKCDPTCASGWGDCTEPAAPTADNGCETNVNSDALACGACNRACSATHVEGLVCASGVCTSSCAMGYVNCSTPAQPTTDDGCEAASSDTNCGGCGNDCTAQGLTCSASLCSCTSNSQCGNNASCSGGVCVCHRISSSSTCRHGEKCGGVPNDCQCNGGSACSGTQVCCQVGCRDVATDPANCGACGRACAPGFACQSGGCVCNADSDCNGGSAGTCSNGVCVCGTTTCAAGQRCLGDGSCG